MRPRRVVACHVSSHHYGPNVHLLSFPYPMSLLAELCAETTRQPRFNQIVAQLYDWDDDVNIGPADDCAAMAGLNDGTTVPSKDRWGEPLCGSERAIAYRTIQNQREGANLYGALEYRFSSELSWFADFQMGRQTVKLLTGTNGNDVASDHMGWEFHDPNSTDNNDKIFFNAGTGHYEIWSRQFAPEEVGGLENRMNSTTQKTFAITTGFNGTLGEDWTWEAAYNHSEYKAVVKMPRIIRYCTGMPAERQVGKSAQAHWPATLAV